MSPHFGGTKPVGGGSRHTLSCPAQQGCKKGCLQPQRDTEEKQPHNPENLQTLQQLAFPCATQHYYVEILTEAAHIFGRDALYQKLGLSFLKLPLI